MSFLFFNLLLFAIIVFLFLVLSMVWPPDSPWAPWWRTNRKTARAMCRLAKVTKDDVIYDLGSGDGTALLVACKEFGAKGIGIEIDPLRALISKIRVKFSNSEKDIKIIRKNFFEVDIAKATVIFVYLVPKALNKLKQKFLKELKSGTRIVSFRYKMDLPLKSYDKDYNINLYTV
ncbi:MAG: hypothetical protein Q7R31_01545 [Candidatus Levybacteria bacterium]|nr:hypothetical protein [Candidatus Levybacteria bacterium]